MLKAKIQQRPPRQELERRHILDADPGHVDPSLAERQRMLKKARLADQLNDHLSHRPGPLELIQKNILHTETIEQAVKTGRISYKATSEGQFNRPQHPHSYITPEEDSQSSEGDNIVSPGSSDVLETAAKSAGIVVSLLPSTEGTVVVTTATPVISKDNSEIVFADLCRSVAAPLLPSQVSVSSPASLVSSTSTLSPLSSIASPVPSIVSQPATPAPPLHQSFLHLDQYIHQQKATHQERIKTERNLNQSPHLKLELLNSMNTKDHQVLIRVQTIVIFPEKALMISYYSNKHFYFNFSCNYNTNFLKLYYRRHKKLLVNQTTTTRFPLQHLQRHQNLLHLQDLRLGWRI